MCSCLSCSRKTRRWPLCMFYGIINMAVLNSYILHVTNSQTRGDNPINRKEFMKTLSDDLCRHWCNIWYEERPKMRKRVREAIEEVLGGENVQHNEEFSIKKRQDKHVVVALAKVAMCILHTLQESKKTDYFE